MELDLEATVTAEMEKNPDLALLLAFCSHDGWQDFHRGVALDANPFHGEQTEDEPQFEPWERAALAEAWGLGWQAGERGEDLTIDITLDDEPVEQTEGEPSVV